VISVDTGEILDYEVSLSSAMSARHTITMTKEVININNGRTLINKDVRLTTRVHLKKCKL
jgi:hypothetical protein